MTVSLDYDPDSDSQGGVGRLRRLASFGRYGADVHASARRSCTTVSAGQRKKDTTEYSLLAASLSSFYGWVAKQTGSRVVLGQSNSKREQRLHVTQRAIAMAKPTAAPKDPALETSHQHSCKTARKSAKRQQHVQLPSVFTMQGVSANTSCFDSLSYRASDNRRVHGLVQSSKHLQAVPMYLEDSVTSLNDNRGGTSEQQKNTNMSPVVSHPRHNGSKPFKSHVMPAVIASHSGPCSGGHKRPQCVSPESLHLPRPQSAGAKQFAVSASEQVPKLDLLCMTPSEELHQGHQQDWHGTQHAQQECHAAQREADSAQQDCLPQTPQTARSSQSDATHLDHCDSHRSDSTCQDASQSAQAALHADQHSEMHQHQATAQHQPPAADAGLLRANSGVFQDDMSACRPPPAPGCVDGLLGRTSPEDVSSDRLTTGRQRNVRPKQARQATRRALQDITNTAKAAEAKSVPAHMMKDNEGRTAASVPDLVTFWEQRASVQQH